jgi:hypothetical protein
VSWFPILLVIHIALALSLLAPSLILPFMLRRADVRGGGNRLLNAVVAMQGSGSLVIGLGLAITGAGLLAMLGTELLGRPWLIVALIIYAANLAVAAFVARPNLRRLIGVRGAGDDAAWRRRARQQRYVAYAMAAATGAIGFLMSTKPELW